MSLLPVSSIRKFPFPSIRGKQESKLFQVGALHTNTQSELLSSCTAFIFQPHKDPLHFSHFYRRHGLQVWKLAVKAIMSKNTFPLAICCFCVFCVFSSGVTEPSLCLSSLQYTQKKR